MEMLDGNEKVGTTAKKVTKGADKTTLTRAIPHTDRKRPVFAAMKLNWLERWQSLDHVSELREIKLGVGIWKPSYNKNRRIETAFVWLRTGCSNQTHLSMEGLTNSLECDLCKNPHHGITINPWSLCVLYYGPENGYNFPYPHHLRVKHIFYSVPNVQLLVMNVKETRP